MHISRQKEQKAMIPTASMADIAFLLIIFFMVTTVHELDRTSVNLPQAKLRVEAEKGAAIVVLAKHRQTPDSPEEILYKFSDGEAMSRTVSGPEDIYLEATRVTYTKPSHQFILKADGSLRFEMIDVLLDNLRKGGVQRVLLLTGQQSTEEGS